MLAQSTHPIGAFRRKYKNIETLTDERFDEMMANHWPHNVCELEHVIEKAAILAKVKTLRV